MMTSNYPNFRHIFLRFFIPLGCFILFFARKGNCAHGRRHVRRGTHPLLQPPRAFFFFFYSPLTKKYKKQSTLLPHAKFSTNYFSTGFPPIPPFYLLPFPYKFFFLLFLLPSFLSHIFHFYFFFCFLLAFFIF